MAGLYIHIPLCKSRCAYCDFYKSTAAERAEEVVGALKREMAARREFLPEGRLDTIYLGGGTPSLLSPEQLRGLLGRAAELWDCSELREVTMEANPEDLTDEYIAGLAGTGFDRLSIGVQSFDDGLLRMMNRRHDAARAKDAVKAAQRAGFDNITIDLIFGIPEMTAAQWERSLDEAIDLGVQHISAYHLTIEPGTAFGQRGLRPIDEAESERQYETLRRRLGDAGFEHYEISNFALPGRRAVHNSAYWSGEPYLGIGPSAHSFDGARRREWVVADIGEYLAGVGGGDIYDGETLSDRELFNERVMTALRTAAGLDLGAMEERFGRERVLALAGRAERFLGDGLLVRGGGSATRGGDSFRVPAERFLMSDFVIGELFE
ncbi:MAG: radical SAM family heme chaperone HemW [Alistipes sp.]|jgi:oxygen-independent coproporphyrinogen-3 oxidase|nr:radical SAM family heme chaperone HemW [Alistipes sp.]